jgi:hypothetical protein
MSASADRLRAAPEAVLFRSRFPSTVGSRPGLDAAEEIGIL